MDMNNAEQSGVRSILSLVMGMFSVNTHCFLLFITLEFFEFSGICEAFVRLNFSETMFAGILGNMKFIVMQLFVSWYVILFYIPAFFVVFQLQNLQVT